MAFSLGPSSPSREAALPTQIAVRLDEVFALMDSKKKGSIPVGEARQFFSKSAFSKVNAKAMIDAIVKESPDSFSKKEWRKYFESIYRDGGYEEEEMLEAIGVMTKGEPFPLVSSASIRKATFQLFS